MIDYSISVYDLEYFLMILTRVSMFIYLAPFFNMSNTPRRVKIALCIMVSVLMYYTMTPAPAIETGSVVTLALIVIKEAMVGLLLGFSCNIAIGILSFAGALADMETGLSMVQAMDPTTRQNVSITASLYSYAFNLMLICTGLYGYILGALKDSYELIPINGAIFRSDDLLNSMVEFMSDYVFLGFRIILPIFCAVLILNAILGIIAKVSPQMNMFSIGVQLKIITGLGVLFLTVGLLPYASEMIYNEMKKMVVLFVRSMV